MLCLYYPSQYNCHFCEVIDKKAVQEGVIICEILILFFNPIAVTLQTFVTISETPQVEARLSMVKNMSFKES